jgi:hypothetical protein
VKPVTPAGGHRYHTQNLEKSVAWQCATEKRQADLGTTPDSGTDVCYQLVRRDVCWERALKSGDKTGQRIAGRLDGHYG